MRRSCVATVAVWGLRHNFGCECAPLELYELYAAIDRAAHTWRWVGR